MRVTTKITWSMVTGEVLEHESYEYSGPVEKCCGASGDLKQLGKSQLGFFNNMVTQAQSIFGNSSNVFNSLIKTFSPIVGAGLNQEGLSAPEKAALESEAVTQSGIQTRNAMQAVKEANAAYGGGNMVLPGGSETARIIQVANAGAENTANQLNKIDLESKELGRANYFKAAAGLAEAPSVFNPATESENAATGAGNSAANTENAISQQNNSWVSSVTGALGGIAGSVVTGGFSNLGKGVGFFGGKTQDANG